MHELNLYLVSAYCELDCKLRWPHLRVLVKTMLMLPSYLPRYPQTLLPS
jgi:hypothetical protein